ncbi:MAG: YabP/YqfC family sporulation protein [Eubacteriales bacterium]|nr:YabP/YqfC family sporulation protein [Eubacteriales bacterium]
MERGKLPHMNGPVIELDANRSIVIAGKCAITLYSETEMRVQCGRLTIRVSGDGLELCTLDENELSIIGLIAEVGFLSGT